jgi:hypothetical protein
MKARSRIVNRLPRLGTGLLALAASLALAGTTASTSAAACPNEALREAQGATALPDCMALEMVSPPKKFAQPAYSPSFSADGERVLFSAQAALAQTPGFQNFGGDRYVAGRTAAGWQTASTAPPLGSIVAGTSHYGGPSAFTPELDRWVQLGATTSESMVGASRLYGGGLDGSFAPLSPLMAAIDDGGGVLLQFLLTSIEVTAASEDLSTTVLRFRQPQFSYLPKDPRNPPGETPDVIPGDDRNSYVIFTKDGEPALELLARDRDGTVYGGRCRAHSGGPNAETSSAATFNQGAISAEGSRIYFSTRPAQPFDSEAGEGPECDTDNPVRIMVRTATETGPDIEPLLPGGLSEWEEAGDDNFEGASKDATKVYLTSPRNLTASDTDPAAEKCGDGDVGTSKGCDLYLFDSAKPVSERLTQVSAGEAGAPTPGEGADVLSSITAISAEGSRAYFVAQGVLTVDPNPEGEQPQAGKPNLYLYDAQADEVAFIGTLADADKGGIWGTKGSFLGDAYATPDVLAFASKAPLSADDSDGGRRDVFRYDADAETLERISKAAPGGSDNGPFDAVVNPNLGKEAGTNFGEQSRWVAEDGQAIAFTTAEALLPDDEDGAANPYLWKEGLLGAARAQVKAPPAISPDGEEIAFATQAALLPQDGDTAEDVYVARVEGGFPFAVQPEPCDPLQEGSCQGAAPALQVPAAPASAAFIGPGNARGPVTCRKGFVKKKVRCVKKQRKQKARKHKTKKRAGHEQGRNR